MELLYADDLIVIVDSEKQLARKRNRWKDGLEKKGMKVNISKTKIMVGGKSSKDADRTVKWPCSVKLRLHQIHVAGYN